jgi:hypothetical protein
MRYILPTVSIIAVAALSGCAGTNHNSVAGSRIPDPYVDNNVNAHLDLKNRVSGSASIETYQVLFVKFNAGGQETNVGNVGNRLCLKDNFLLNPLELLFRSPADRQAAVDAAYYNAVQNGNCDGLINTRVQVHSDGFSILGLYGHGTANATVDAYGLNMTKGILPNVNNASPKAVTKSFLQGLFGEEKQPSQEAPKAVAKKKPAVSAEAAPAMAKAAPAVVTDKNGTAYLASTVSVPQHPFGKLPSNDNGF